MIYLDSSALVKLIAPEAESKQLSEWVRGNWERTRATSALSQVDVLRVFRDVGPAAEDLAAIVLDKIERLPVSSGVLADATARQTRLSTMGAVHLATARTAGEALFAYVSYDADLLAAAEWDGMPTASPGAERATTVE